MTDLKDEKQRKLADLENEISLKKNEIDQREKEQAKLKQSERDAVAAMSVTQAEAKKLREEVDGLAAEAKNRPRPTAICTSRK